jgi:hypothetical protein
MKKVFKKVAITRKPKQARKDSRGKRPRQIQESGRTVKEEN